MRSWTGRAARLAATVSELTNDADATCALRSTGASAFVGVVPSLGQANSALLDRQAEEVEMGMGGPECVCDMDGDEWVGVEDFSQFLQVYGSDCEGNLLPPPTVRQLEELDLNPTYLTMEGKRVSAGPAARGE